MVTPCSPFTHDGIGRYMRNACGAALTGAHTNVHRDVASIDVTVIGGVRACHCFTRDDIHGTSILT